MLKISFITLIILLLITGCIPQKQLNQTKLKVFKTDKMYYEYIYDSLAKGWNPDIYSLEKVISIIDFNIDTKGQFKYRIIEKSINDEFNKYVEAYLEKQTRRKFLFYKRKTNVDIRLYLNLKYK